MVFLGKDVAPHIQKDVTSTQGMGKISTEDAEEEIDVIIFIPAYAETALKCVYV